MLRGELALFFSAIGYFTRLPVPAWVGYDAAGLSRAARYLPAVGLLVGAGAGAVYWLAVQLWAPPVGVLLAIAAGLLLTGALHEDGLADTADGLGGGWDKARILEIMKDSRVGSYGVIATALALLGRYTLLAGLDPAAVPLALLAGHALSRLCATTLMAGLDYARSDDATSKARPLARRLGAGPWLFAAGCGLLPLLALDWPRALAALGLAGLASAWLAGKFRRWLGGYTGDCLGATQQLAELAVYLGLALRLPAGLAG